MNQVFHLTELLGHICLRNTKLYWNLVQISLDLAHDRVYYAQILTVKTVIQKNYWYFGYWFEKGDVCWTINGIIHREDGPAVERANGTKAWYQHGKRHREKGPAVEYPNGTKAWWLEGKFIREEYSKTEKVATKHNKFCAAAAELQY